MVVVDGDFADQVDTLSALAEPARRALYLYVAGQPHPVGRDEAATAVGLPRHTAKFHLDKLVDEGLLDVVFARRTGRSGPGAGRPSKLYRRARCDVAVTLPERHYDLAGDLLAAAMAEAETSGESPRAALDRLAYERGKELGDGSGRDAALRLLETQGYEPRVEDGAITLANCPFHRLARGHTELVCGMNLRLLDGVLDGVPETGLTARLQPSPGRCCVRLEPTAET
jgi:predicted ArsR family transcriptional regulator